MTIKEHEFVEDYIKREATPDLYKLWCEYENAKRALERYLKDKKESK